MKLITQFILFLLFFTQTVTAQNLSQTVRGTVTDRDSKAPLAGVSVSIAGKINQQSVTDAQGQFRFEKIPLGRVSLLFNSVGYESLTLTNIVINSGKEAVVLVEMQPAISQLESVTISANKFRLRASNEMSIAGARSVSPEQTNRYAGGFNDPSRILSNFAGVTNTGDGSNDIIVRGNSPKYIQWRLEGLQMANPNHFADQSAAGGSVSLLNNNILASSDFYTGAFSAEFGDALSGVYDLTLRTGNNEKLETIFGAGVIGTELTVEGPFRKGYKGSFLFNYRYSTVSLIQRLGLFDAINGQLNFQDAAFKIVLPTQKAGSFSFFGLGGLSDFLFKDVNASLWQPPAQRYAPSMVSQDYRKKSHLTHTGITHTISLDKKSSLHTALGYTSEAIRDEVLENFLYKIYNNGSPVKDSAVNGLLNFDGRLRKQTLRAEITYLNRINARNSLQLGVKFANARYKLNQSMLPDSSSPRFMLVDFNEDINSFRSFVNWKYRIRRNITMVAGVHNMNVFYNNKTTVEPRLALNWQINPVNAINLAYGRHSSLESIHHYFAKVKTASGAVTEPNKDLDLLKADHFVIGYKRNLSTHLSLTVEMYYQRLFDIPVASNAANIFSTLNEGLEFQYIALVNKGKGRNKGIELTLEKFFANNYYYLVNATVFRSTYQGSDGIERNTRFSGDYLVNALFGREFPGLGKKKNQVFAINGKIFAGGGKKILPLLRDNAGNVSVDPRSNRYYDYSKAYEKKLGDIYFLTLSFSYKFNTRKATHELFLNIDNITNNRAKLSEFYNPRKPGSVDYVLQSPAFPNLMYRVYF